jgi:D-tyrosyl-tRNA(Tyr) deacylase
LNKEKKSVKALLQRVKNASVTIDGELYSEISKGVLVLFCVEKGDTSEQALFLANKISNLRMFEDESCKMNLSLKDINGEVLVVSQFTLAADCKKGTRPSFDKAEEPARANDLYEEFVSFVKTNGLAVKTGKFAAMMDVSLVNDGPVTFMLTK